MALFPLHLLRSSGKLNAKRRFYEKKEKSIHCYAEMENENFRVEHWQQDIERRVKSFRFADKTRVNFRSLKPLEMKGPVAMHIST